MTYMSNPIVKAVGAVVLALGIGYAGHEIGYNRATEKCQTELKKAYEERDVYKTVVQKVKSIVNADGVKSEKTAVEKKADKKLEEMFQ